MTAHTAVLRAGRDDDAPGIIALIAAAWAEYPGCVMDLDGEVPELRTLASYYAEAGGALWAAEWDGRVVGIAAARPCGTEAAWEICRVYVAREARGGGLAHRLLDAAEAHAKDRGAARLVLWSDTRFERAHRFYEKRGYVRQGAIRALDDLSRSLEFRYLKPCAGNGVLALDVAGIASAARSLDALLGAAPGRGPPEEAGPRGPAREDALWRRLAGRVAEGRASLLAGWHAGTAAGLAWLDLPAAAAAAHRAELRLLLVAPEARRRGLGRALLRAAEATARAGGRTLLTARYIVTPEAEALRRAAGWREAGVVPGYAAGPAGAWHAAAWATTQLPPPSQEDAGGGPAGPGR